MIFLSKLTFSKILSGTLSECQIAWIQIRNHILSGLICIQTDSKDYQQTTKFAAGRQRAMTVQQFKVLSDRLEAWLILWLLTAFTVLTFRCSK